jgi:hypothetical protein
MSGFVFCRDGVLRIRDWHRGTQASVLLPVRTLERTRRNLFLKQITDGVELEAGLTVRELFENLAPWADLMEGLAGMDFDAFLAEARLPPSPNRDFDRVEISYSIFVNPAVQVREPFRADRPGRTDRLEMEEGWDYLGILKEPVIEGEGEDWAHPVHGYSLEFVPLEQWAHLPVVIAGKARITDSSCGSPDPVPAVPLLNPDHPMAHVKGEPGPRPAGRKAGTGIVEADVAAPCPTFIAAIVRGFLYEVGFHYSPCSRDQKRSELAEMVREVTDSAGGNTGRSPERLLTGERGDEGGPALTGAGQAPADPAAGDGTDPADTRLDAEIAFCRLEDPAGPAAVKGLPAPHIDRIVRRVLDAGGGAPD